MRRIAHTCRHCWIPRDRAVRFSLPHRSLTSTIGIVIGTVLAQYQIESLLGQGGMGEVYRARDTKLGRSVAIKVLPEVFRTDPDRVARFEREAKVLAALNHPNIAALHGMEEAAGRHFLVMELVEGETLADRLARGPLPIEEALHIAVQIAEALEAAHEKGRHPPRSQTGEHQADARRQGEGSGLRAREGDRRGGRGRTGRTGRRRIHTLAHPEPRGNACRGDSRHGGVHVAGAGRRACPPIIAATSSRSARWSTRC